MKWENNRVLVYGFCLLVGEKCVIIHVKAEGI